MNLARWTCGRLFLAVIAASAGTAAHGSPLYDTAIVHYEFETLGGGGEVTDSNSNSVNLVSFDAAGVGASAALVTGPGGEGNGIHLPDGVVLTTTGTGSDDSVLDTTRDTPFTVAAWVKLEAVGDRFFLVSKVQREEFGDGDSLELRGWSLDIGAGGKLTGLWRRDHTPTTGTVGEARIIVDSTTTITDTNWHHVALTFDYDEADTTRGMRMYMDGLLVGMNPVSTGLAGVDDVDLSATGWPFNVSGRYDAQLNEGGSADDLAIWKSVLSPQDIASLAGATLGTPGDFDGDSDVDGRDFLVWQRGGSPSPLSASDLSDWQANYGVSPPAAANAGALSVPEPASAVLVIVGLVVLRLRHHQK